MSDYGMFATYPVVVRNPNGTYTRGGWLSNVKAPEWTISQETGQVTVNSTYAPEQNVEPNDPNCQSGGDGASGGGWTYLPDTVGSYLYESWVIYAYGQGGYQYPGGGKACINQPFTYEIIKIASLQVTVSPNASAPSISSFSASTTTFFPPYQIPIVSSTDIQPSATGQTYRTGAAMRGIQRFGIVSALLSTLFTLTFAMI